MARTKKKKKPMSDADKAKLANYTKKHGYESYNGITDFEESELEPSEHSQNTTISESKLCHLYSSESEDESESDSSENSEEDNGTQSGSGYRLWDWGQLQQLIGTATVCSECHTGTLLFVERIAARRGWCSGIGLSCSNTACTRSSSPCFVSTSPVRDGRADINVMGVTALRTIGRGRSGAEKLSAFLNLPRPLHYRHWRNHEQYISDAARECAEDQMKQSGQKVRRQEEESCNEEELISTAVSVDGAWQRRGMSSHHGIVAAVSASTGEVLDVHYMTNHCFLCQKWEDKDKTSEEYMEFYVNHFPQCNLNHEGSAPAMEPEGAVAIFQRSVEKHNLRYTTFIGDGDSKSYKRVTKDQPYGPEYPIQKEECIGHVQKRMGTRLRKLVSKKSGQKLADGKGLGGKGRLTEGRVDYFQFLYGCAIRDNKGNVASMGRQTKAILNHYSEPADHRYCIKDKCSFLRDPDNHVPVADALPEVVKEEIAPIFEDLASVKLLAGCINLRTQNANEAFHHVLWGFVPKDVVQSASSMRFGVSLAVLLFNRGYTYTSSQLYDALSLPLSDSSKATFYGMDTKRISESKYKASEQRRDKRAKQRNRRRKRQDAFKKKEGTTYKSGMMHKERAARKCRTCGVPLKGSGHKRGVPCTANIVYCDKPDY